MAVYLYNTHVRYEKKNEQNQKNITVVIICACIFDLQIQLKMYTIHGTKWCRCGVFTQRRLWMKPKGDVICGR